MIGVMGLPAEKPRYTIAEYLQREELAVDRHEFHDGEILAMPAGTYAHAMIGAHLATGLHGRSKSRGCHPLGCNMRVRIPSRQSYIYPDISIVCGEPALDVDDPKKTTITNPKAVIEVLSESTEMYNRVQKFALYRELESLQEYVLVAQNQPMIETYFRQPEGAWLFQTWSGIEATAVLRSLELTIPLAEIYRGVDFPA